jgi:hypothetical protein
MTFKPGDLISISQKPDTTYQVVNFDDFSDCVWVRRWPLGARSSATFAVHGSEIRPQVAELRR